MVLYSHYEVHLSHQFKAIVQHNAYIVNRFSLDKELFQQEVSLQGEWSNLQVRVTQCHSCH